MIAKRIDMRDASKSRATRLAKYVTDELERADRVAAVFTANCISDDALLAAKEIEICQAKNTRAKDDKTYHLLLSFPDGERPEMEHMRAMADAAAKALGYGDHQRIAVIHDDTDNLHMHLIINKIHPARLTIHTPRRDFNILGELCMKLERDNALRHTNHQPVRSAGENKARDMEAHSGLESFLSYTRKKIPSIVSAAQSWEALHRALAEAGVSLRLKGNGLVFVDHTGAVAIKASAVARDFSKGKLEKRFGVFVPYDAPRQPKHSPLPFPAQPSSTYQKTPLASPKSLYQQYQSEMTEGRQQRKAQLAALWEKQQILIRQIAASARLDLPKAASYHLKRTLRLQANSIASARTAELRKAMAKERADIKARHKALGYIEWLKRAAEDGNVSAMYTLRKRGVAAPAVINITARDLRNTKFIAAKIIHVTSRGTLFYKVGKDVFRDNGSNVSLKRDVSDGGVVAALRIAMVKFNSQPLTVNGTDEFKNRCVRAAVASNLPLTFSDDQLEKQRRDMLRAVKQDTVSHEQKRQAVHKHHKKEVTPRSFIPPSARGASR